MNETRSSTCTSIITDQSYCGGHWHVIVTSNQLLETNKQNNEWSYRDSSVIFCCFLSCVFFLCRIIFVWIVCLFLLPYLYCPRKVFLVFLACGTEKLYLLDTFVLHNWKEQMDLRKMGVLVYQSIEIWEARIITIIIIKTLE